MDYNNNIIKSLLDKYWEGETSLSEETTLFEYFNGEKVAKELKTFQPMFQYFKAEKVAKIENENFERDLLAELSATTIVPIRSRRKGIIRTLTRVAAVILVVMSVYLAYQQFAPTTDAPKGDYLTLDDLTDEERQAYETTKMALYFVSSKLNKGTKIATDNFIKVQKKAQQAAEEQ